MPTSSVSGGSLSPTTVTPLTFSGQSKYSTDFQNIIDKYVSASSIQLKQLQRQQTADQNQLTAIASLDAAFTNLQDSLNSLTTAIGAESFTGSVSDPSVASITVGDNAWPGTFTLEIDSLGAITQTISTAGLAVTNPNQSNLSSDTSYSLTINGNTTTIKPVHNTLAGLASAINAAGLGVSASIVNAGTSSSPDYRLSVQSTTLADDTIQLTDSSNTQYLSQIGPPGAPATYRVDGLPTLLESDSSSVTIAPGVTVNLLAQTPAGSPITIGVQQTSNAAAGALANLASAYDQVVNALDAQHGLNAGALSGSSILIAAQRVMQSIGLYTDAGGNGISNIGLNLDASGNLSFNATRFAANFGGNMQELSNFLGDTTTGFIASASNAISSLMDLESGLLTSEENTLSSAMTKLGRSITDQVTMINNNQQNLFTHLSNADATIFSLTNQVTYFRYLFFPNANASTNG